MILKEWGEALDIYKATSVRWRRSLKAILALHKVRSYWYVWATLLFLILSAAYMIPYIIPGKAYGSQWWTALSPWLIVPLAALCAYVAMEKALAKEFKADYAEHGISHYPFWSRRGYFVYTLFLQELRDRKYSHTKVAELNEAAEIVEPLEALPVRPFQHPLVIPLVGVLTALSIEVTKQSVSNDSRALLFLILGGGVPLLVLVHIAISLWSNFMNFAKNRHQVIKRYLQRAERDLKEDQPF